jgi:hypothetical protein
MTTLETKNDRAAQIRQYSPNGLAVLADCHNDNDAADEFLIGIRDAVIELTDEIGADDWQRLAVENYAGAIDELRDSAVSVYTWEKWQQFIGTRAWSEDLSDWMPDTTDLDKLAALALYSIAQRLAVALVAEIADCVKA